MKVLAQASAPLVGSAQGANESSFVRTWAASVLAALAICLMSTLSTRCASLTVYPLWRASGEKALDTGSELPTSACTEFSNSALDRRRMRAGRYGEPETAAWPALP